MEKYNRLLGMLLEAIDYSFLQTDGSYDKSLTYPVIDKIQYIKEQLKDAEVKEVDFHKELLSFYRHTNSGSTIALAKHFFELGMSVSNKIQKREDV